MLSLCQHVEEGDTCTPHIHSLIIPLILQHLRRLEVVLPGLSKHLQTLLKLEGNVEVKDFNLLEIISHVNIAGFYVSVADVLLMNIS